MTERLLNRTKCHNPYCQASIEMPDAIHREVGSYLSRSAMRGDFVGVSCGECKHAYPYSIAEFHAAGMTDTPDPFHSGKLNLFHVHLECGNEDCEFLAGVFAPRPAHVQLDDLHAELGDWVVVGVRCACGMISLSPKPFSLHRREPGSDDRSEATS
jgi:hypothetical protein